MKTMAEGEFLNLYKNLNRQQKMAVDAIEGPVMVVAGPGTGKTHILTLRIGNILRKTDLGPEAILALTFTESAAAAMRRRLAEIIGSPAYQVEINTFHGFCNSIIKNNPESFPAIIGSESADEIEQIKIVEKILVSKRFRELKPFGDNFYYLKTILSSIRSLKREAIEPGQFLQTIKEEVKDFKNIADLRHERGAFKGKIKSRYQKLAKNIAKLRELAEIYQCYQKELKKRKLYDYEDMIVEVLKTLKKDRDLLLDLQERYQYVLVDEHQDTNNGQNKIIELICGFHSSPNIFVVGDEKQAIFRFQGASLENFLYFKKLYPKAKLVVLEQNYRSSQPILDSAHSLIAGPGRLKAQKITPAEKIKVFEFSSPQVEAHFLAKDIREKIKNGTSPGEITVLYRDNKDAFYYTTALEKEGIPFSIESDQDILSDKNVGKTISLLETVNDFGSDEKLAAALHCDFLNIVPLDIYKVISHAGRNKISIFDVIKSRETLEKISLEEPEKFTEIYQKLSRWAVLAKNENAAELFETVVRESGFLNYLLERPDSLEELNKLNGLFDEIKEQLGRHKNLKLKDFLDYLNTLKTHEVLIKKDFILPLADRVRLMTVHKSKGQEFDYVYIVNAVDGHFGNRRRPELLPLPERLFILTSDRIDPANQIDDERRLFYVAITRAKRLVSISWARTNSAGREQLACQFIGEIKPNLLEKKPADKYERTLAKNKEIIFAPRTSKGVDIKEKKFVRELFLTKGLSVTALNNYLECPWKYFYSNLLRLPQAMTKHQMYGLAAHGALKDFFDNLTKSKTSRELLSARFHYHLSRQPLNNGDYRELLARGDKALSGYYRTYTGKWPKKVLTEFSIAGVILTPKIRLTGKLDKVEILNGIDEVNVVDYKTSKPKSRGVIEGKTKNSKGDIKRQLAFYNLLLNEYNKGRYKMISGEIDFIEPDDKGRYKKEKFIIEPSEIKELKELIKRTADEIINLKFWNRRCDDHDCQFCVLVSGRLSANI